MATVAIVPTVAVLHLAPDAAAQGVLVSDSPGRSRTVTDEEFRTMKVVRYEIWMYGDNGKIDGMTWGSTPAKALRDLETLRRDDLWVRRDLVTGRMDPPTAYTRSLYRIRGPVAIIDVAAQRERELARKQQELQRKKEQKEAQERADEARASQEAESARRQERVRKQEQELFDANRRMMDAENARIQRDANARQAQEVADALARARSYEETGAVLSDAVRDIGNIFSDYVDRKERREEERRLRAEQDRREEAAERAAYEERKAARERYKDGLLEQYRQDHERSWDEAFETDSTGLRIKGPQDGPEIPVFPSASPQSVFDYGSLGSDDSSVAVGGRSLIGSLLHALATDDGDAGSEVGADAAGDPAQAGGGSALRTLFGGSVRDDGDPASDEGSGESRPALRALAARFAGGSGADVSGTSASAPNFIDLVRKVVDVSEGQPIVTLDEAVEKFAERHPALASRVREAKKYYDYYKLLRDGDSLDIAETAIHDSMEYAGDRIPLATREPYYRWRLVMAWMSRDRDKVVNAYDEYLDKMVIGRLPKTEGQDESGGQDDSEGDR